MSINLNKRKVILEQEIKEKLLDGKMPLISSILRSLTSRNYIERSDSPARKPEDMMDGQVIEPKIWNNLVEEVEIDLQAMRKTLDDSWERIEDTADKIISVSPEISREADFMKQLAIRALALTPLADGVSVRQEAIAVSGGTNFSTLKNVDMKLSQEIESDKNAGSISIKKSSANLVNANAMIDYTFGSDNKISFSRKIGSPLWTIGEDISKTFSIAFASSSKYGEVWIEMYYKLTDKPSAAIAINRLDIELPTNDFVKIEAYVKTGSPGNWRYYGTSTGSSKVTLYGPIAHATDVRIKISKFIADDSFFHGDKLVHGYVFNVTNVSFMKVAHAPQGNIVSDPISLGNTPISSMIVDMDSIVPDTSSVSLFVGSEESNPQNINDIRWIPVSKDTGIVELLRLKDEQTLIVAEHPTKIVEKQGRFSNDIWSIGKTGGRLTLVEEGIDQLEVQRLTVDETVAFSSSGWDNVNVYGVIEKEDAVLPPGNYFRLKTKIYSPSAYSGSIPISIDSSLTQEYQILLNGLDVTERMDSGSDSIGLISGENILEIIIKTIESVHETPILDFRDIVGGSIMIDRPSIVSELSLNGPGYRVSRRNRDGAVLLNHNIKNRSFRIYSEAEDKNPVKDLRVRAQLTRGLDGSSPQIKAVYLTSGV